MKKTNGKAKATKVAKVTKTKAAKATRVAKVQAKADKVRTDALGTKLTNGQKWGSGMEINESMIITAVAPNNKRGASRERFAKYKVGRTVGQTLAIEGGPHRGDIRWDAGRGLIELGRGKPAKAGKGKAA